MTLVTPRHSVRRPSIRYIVDTACESPVYKPPAEGFMICIRVCGDSSVSRLLREREQQGRCLPSSSPLDTSPYVPEIHVSSDCVSCVRAWCIPQFLRMRPPTYYVRVHSWEVGPRSCENVNHLPHFTSSTELTRIHLHQVVHLGCSTGSYSLRAMPQGIWPTSPRLQSDLDCFVFFS